jgi:hypothetical protein
MILQREFELERMQACVYLNGDGRDGEDARRG